MVAEPATFRGQAIAEATSLADAPWWQVFQDPALRDLIQEALRSNYDVQIAAARVQEARAFLTVSRSDYFPSLDYNVNGARGDATAGLLGPGPQAPKTTNNYSATMAMSWELDIWGRIRRLNEVARANLFAAEDFRRGVWLTLVSDLGQAYFELLALDVQLDIARNSTAAYQRTYDLFEDRYRFGAASKLETSRAEGALGGAQATIPQIQSAIVAKENQISILLGKPPGPIVRGVPMYEQPVVPEVPAGLPSALLERRPDLRQVEQQLVAANARIGVAKAEFFPKLSLTALFGTASPEISALTGGSATIWAVGGIAQRPAVQRRPHAGDLPRSGGAVGAGAAAVRADGPHRAARGLRRAHRARQAERGRDGTGSVGEGAGRSGRARDGPLSPGAGQLLRSPRGPAAALPRAERAGADPPRPPPRVRPSLQGARGRLEPDGSPVDGSGSRGGSLRRAPPLVSREARSSA